MNLAEPSSSLDRKFEVAILVYPEGYPDVVWHKNSGFIVMAKSKDFDGFGILGVCQLCDAITRYANSVLPI